MDIVNNTYNYGVNRELLVARYEAVSNGSS